MDTEACIHIRHIFVSKEQLELNVGIVDRDSLRKVDYKTPLTIKIQSRAVTKINGEPLKLKKNQDPYILDYTSQDRLLITFKEENLIKIELEWIPLNISFLNKSTPTHDVKYLIHEIESTARKGVDLRMSENALNGTHFISTDSALDVPLVISLVKNIPILNPRWLKEVSNWPDDLSKWFFDPERSGFTLDLDRHSSSKEKRNSLFKGCLFVTISDYNENHDDLVLLLSLIGGSLVTVSQVSNLRLENKHNILPSLHKYLESTSSSHLYLLKEDENDSSGWLSHFINDGLPVSSMEDLLRAIVASNSSVIQCVDFSNVRSDDIVEQPRKRRRFQKVDKTKFLDFGFSVPQETRAVNDIPSTDNKHASNDDRITDSSSLENSKDIENTELNVLERKTESPITKDDLRERSNDVPKETSDDTITEKLVDTPATNVSDNSANKENRLSKVTMSDAIKTIKERETSNIRDKLGLSEIKDDLSDQVNDLSLVEYIDMNRKHIRPSSSSKHILEKYEGRKNFKTFRKIKPSYLMSTVGPNKVGLKAFDSDDNDFRNAEMQKLSEEDPSLRMAIDFGDASATQGNEAHSKSKESAPIDMDDQEDALFVPDDSQDVANEVDGETFNSFMGNKSITPSRSTYQNGRNKAFTRENYGNNANYIDDDNDDADDDEPKFSFKRS